MNETLQMVFWDVQHGHATYLRTPNGKHIVIDLGIGSYDDNNQQFSPLSQLKDWGMTQLDLLVVTHPHLDHIDDVLNIKALNLWPKVLLRPHHLTNEDVMGNLKRESDRAKFELYCFLNGYYVQPVPPELNVSIPTNWGGVKMTFFSPTNCDKGNFNNHSIVCVFEYANLKVVIPGDNEKASFEELYKQAGFQAAVKDSDILLAPHHGRDSGLYEPFVKLVNPRITIVSDGSFCTTSANPYYSNNSRGWGVQKMSDGIFTDRKCLTTNSDGEIFVDFGFNQVAGRTNFLHIRKK